MTKYSNSKLSTFENCPLQYKFAYIDCIKRDTEGIEAFMGSRVHDALEKLYKDIKMTKINTLDELLAFYDIVWKNEWNDSIKITKQEYTPENYYDKGVYCIKAYYQRYYPFDQGVVIATEESLSGYLDDDQRYLITGIVDRVDLMPDGTYEIHDYKTSNTLETQEHLDSDRQLALYHFLLKQRWPDADKVELVWHYLGFDKELRSSRTTEQLAKTVSDTVQAIDTIEAAITAAEFPTEESALCGWCAYHDLCPMKKHEDAVSKLPENKYLADDGIQLVSKFSKLSEDKCRAKKKLDDIEAEIDELKEAVIAYADKNGYEVIRGVDKQLTVKRKTKLKFPNKDEVEKRGQLEDILREIGKWDEVSQFDRHALARIVDDGRWPEELLDRVREFIGYEETVKVTLSKD